MKPGLKSNLQIIILLIFCFIIGKSTTAQYNYWVPLDPPKSQYKIKVKIDVQNKAVEGTGTIILPNQSGKEISVIALDWSISDFQKLEISSDGKSLTMLNSKAPPISSPLIFALPKPIQPGSQAKFQIKFYASNLIGNDTDEILLKNWYPRLWWDGLPVHDSFAVKLDVPSEYALVASGRLNKSTGYFENDGVKTFGIYLGKGLNTERKKVDDILITALFADNGSTCAKLCLDTAADVVKFYKQWLGFYPFDFLYIIPGAPDPWGGYPFASGIVVIHGQEKFDTKPVLHWKWITAHEIGHQYWGEYVMDDDVPAWLWIGMGIYADREYTISRNLGMDKHNGLMNRYRDGLIKHYDTTVDIPLVQFKQIKFDHNNVVIHGKGFSIISALESVLGKPVFQNIYKKCLTEYGGKRLGYKEFWRVCEEETGQDLDWFFEQWVKSNKYLAYKILSAKCITDGDYYISKVKVERLGTMQMPIPVKASFEDGSSEVKFTNRLLDINEINFQSKSKLKQAILNPENTFAMFDSALTPFPEEVVDMISQLPWTGAGEKALKSFQQAKDLKLVEPDSWYKLGLTLFDGGYLQESYEAFKKHVNLNPAGMRRFTAFVWMGYLKDLLGERDAALKHYQEALKNDTGGTMRHDQYGLKINREWVEQRLKTPFVRGKN